MTLPNYAPDSKTTFNFEFDRFASSQQLIGDQKRKAKVEGIRDEIIQYYLPNGVRFKAYRQKDDNENADLDDDEFLEIFQRMCKAAGKNVYSSINDSLLELKDHPYVNIMEFIDSCRTETSIPTFDDWHGFVDYTLDGRKIDLQFAEEDEFLAPLLQDLRNGPGAVDPISVHRRFMAIRDVRRSERKVEATEAIAEIDSSPVVTTQELPRSLSPSFFNQGSVHSSSPGPISPNTGVCGAIVLPRTPLPSRNEPASALVPGVVFAHRGSSPIDSEISDSDLIELSIRVERATQELPLSRRRLKSPTPPSEISDSDLIELSMRLEASTQNTGSSAAEAIDLPYSVRGTTLVLGKHDMESSPVRPVRRSKRLRKASRVMKPP